VAPDTSRSFGDRNADDRMPRMLMAIGGFFSKMYSYFARS
jgi:hypothetical protein